MSEEKKKKREEIKKFQKKGKKKKVFILVGISFEGLLGVEKSAQKKKKKKPKTKNSTKGLLANEIIQKKNVSKQNKSKKVTTA